MICFCADEALPCRAKKGIAIKLHSTEKTGGKQASRRLPPPDQKYFFSWRYRAMKMKIRTVKAQSEEPP